MRGAAQCSARCKYDFLKKIKIEFWKGHRPDSSVAKTAMLRIHRGIAA